MLPDLTSAASPAAVLQNPRWVFTAPSFATFTALVTGLVANTGAGTATRMLTAAGLAQSVPHNRMHRFFARGLEQRHTRPVLVPPDRQNAAAGRRGTDGCIVDTVFKKHGRKVHGAAWQHDGGARGKKPAGYGVCFVPAGIIVEPPFCSRPFRLPVAVRLWRPKSETSKVDIAAALVELIALWHREARVHVVADAAYTNRIYARRKHPL